MNSPEPHIHEIQSLFFETSPYGNIDALVEHDGRAVHFYLNGKGFGTRACWIRNLVPGPYVLNTDEMQQGLPPLLPRTHCKYSDGRPLFDPESLSVVWLEEGNGAALFFKDEIIGVIPPWSGAEGFHGYAAECASENPICWPLPANPQLAKRIESAREFWNDCSSGDTHPFSQLQPRLLEHYEKCFGSQQNYYSIDSGQFPPRGLAQFENNILEHETVTTLVTAGMSLCPQPNVELVVENPSSCRRIELAMEVSETELIEPLLAAISSLAQYPWQNQSWYGARHTVRLPGIDRDDFRFAALVSDHAVSQERERAKISLGSFRHDPINLLWLIPISEEEQKSLAANQMSFADWLSNCDWLPH